ncbi:MAG: secondary thiamine-phosphate synthase enzyme YjbQ [Aggregatilineales bacterium]
MPVETMSLRFEALGDAHITELTAETQEAIRQSGIQSGTATLFVPGSTAGLTTIEFEEGAVKDFQRLFDEIAHPERDYAHNERWGDGNGHSHVRAALLGPSLTVPFTDGKLLLGQWQQIIFVDFDNRPRSRVVVVQVVGE